MQFPQNAPLQMHPKYLIGGQFQRDFVIRADGTHRLDIPGGSALFAAAGLAIWDQPLGLMSRVGEDYPRQWLDDLQIHQMDARGVKILHELVDARSFYGYSNASTFDTRSPVGFFARFQIPFPNIMLNYKSQIGIKDDLKSVWTNSPRGMDLPPDYLDATAAFLCPMDYLSHSLLQHILRGGAVQTIMLEASPGYLQPEYFNQLVNVVAGLNGFLVNEVDLRLFFRNRSTDLVEMAVAIADIGCEMVVIRQVDGTRLLYDRSSRKKWLIPVYPVNPCNYHSAMFAFGGGLLAGYQMTYDPIKAAMHGAISESMAAESLHPLHMFDALPGLQQARLGVMTEMVRAI